MTPTPHPQRQDKTDIRCQVSGVRFLQDHAGRPFDKLRVNQARTTVFVIATTTFLFFASIASAQRPIQLLEPLPDGVDCIAQGSAAIPATCQNAVTVSGTFGVMNAYLRPMMAWGFGVLAGLTVLMIIIGGFQIMLSGGSDIRNSEGTKRILSALIGLFIILFSATILFVLNSSFFVP